MALLCVAPYSTWILFLVATFKGSFLTGTAWFMSICLSSFASYVAGKVCSVGVGLGVDMLGSSVCLICVGKV